MSRSKSLKCLTGLEVSEVSLVGKGANRKKFLVFKNQKGTSMNDHTALLEKIKKGVNPQVSAAIASAVQACVAKRDAESDGGVQKELSDEAQAAMTAALRLLAPFTEELTGDDITSFVDALGLDAGAEDDESADDAPDMATKAMPADDKDMGDAKAKPFAKPADDEEEDKKDMAKGDDTVTKSVEDIRKGIPTELQQHLDVVFKAHAALQAQHEQVAKALKVERDHRVTGEFVAKAAKFKNLGVAPTKLGAILKSLHETDPKVGTELEGILKTLDGQAGVAGGVFSEVGSRATDAEAGDALTRSKILIQDAVAKSAGSGRTKEQVERDFYRSPEGRKLYAEIQNNR